MSAATPAYANFLEDLFNENIQNDLSDVASNVVSSAEGLPGLISGLSYMVALLFGVTGILKLKDHVENPSQTPIRIPIARFLIGGALLALPIVYEAMEFAIGAGSDEAFDRENKFSFTGALSDISGIVAGIIGQIGVNEDLNFIMASIISSLRNVPALISAVAYLLGLLFGVLGLLKLKDHIENPDQNPMKDGVIRLLVGGALFALPTVFYAMTTLWVGDGEGTIAKIVGLVNDLSDLLGGTGEQSCSTVEGSVSSVLGPFGVGEQASLGNAMCNLILHTSAFSAFLEALAYVFGLVIGLWGILKIQDHVLNPQQTSIWEGVSRFITAGAFFAFPFVLEVFKNTVVPPSAKDTVFGIGDIIEGGIGVIGDIFEGAQQILCLIPGVSCPDSVEKSCEGLDVAVACFVTDIFMPFSALVSTFSVFAGMLLIMIGISRLMKSTQEGAKGPLGIGTIMTFITGGALLSYNQLLGAFSSSMFNSDQTKVYGALQYVEGMSSSEIKHAETIISSIVQFVLLVGIVSFVRGIFIVRGVAEGNQQASMMAGITHLVGGALAVNLGPLMNAVQATLGISTYGIQF